MKHLLTIFTAACLISAVAGCDHWSGGPIIPCDNTLLIDFNNDGILDNLAYGSSSTHKGLHVTIYIQDGATQEFIRVMDAKCPNGELSIKDVNGDGNSDIVYKLMGRDAETLTAFNNGDGTFEVVTSPE